MTKHILLNLKKWFQTYSLVSISFQSTKKDEHILLSLILFLGLKSPEIYYNLVILVQTLGIQKCSITKRFNLKIHMTNYKVKTGFA